MISQLLCDEIGKEEFSQYFDEGETRLIQCFLNHDLMVDNPETECELIDYNEMNVLEHSDKQKRDPIREMFIFKKQGKLDIMPQHFKVHFTLFYIDDTLLRHTLANLIAVIMACPRRSNPLWYHLYAPIELFDTYIPGFRVCFNTIVLSDFIIFID